MALGWNNVSVMTWPPNGMTDLFGMNTQWNGADHNGNDVLWGPDEPAPTLHLEGASLDMSFLTLSRVVQGASGLGPAFTVLVSNTSSDAQGSH